MPQDTPRLFKFLWQKLGYATPEEARNAGIDPAYKTYEWLHAVAEKAENKRIPWPCED